MRRTLSKSWDDSIFSESAQAAFWCALSLPPLLLGMLGSLAYIAPLFGPDTLPTIEEQLISTADRFFSPNVVNEIIEPTVRDIVKGARGEVVSLGFVISLWAGSSAISAFVDSIVEAHDQTPLRHPVRQRFFALGLYVVMLVVAIVTAPFVALGPRKIAELHPGQLGQRPALRLLPGAVRRPGRRGEHPLPGVAAQTAAVAPAGPGSVLATVVFLVATLGLRVYLTWITSTGYTYGALATPIAFLLFAFFLGFAIMLGAELNAAIQEEWPAPVTRASASDGGWRRRPRTRQRSRAGADRGSPADAKATPLLLEGLVDPLAVGQTGEPGLAAFVTGNTSPHSATTCVPITALSAILSFLT